MTRLECKQLCVLKLGDIVGYAKPQKVKPGINWGQTAAVTNTLHTHTHVHVCSVWDCPPSGPSWKQYNMTHRKTFRYTHLLTCMAVYWVAAHFDNPDCRLQPAACTAHKTLENITGLATFLQAQPDHASQMLSLQSLFSSRLVCNTWGFSASLSIIKKTDKRAVLLQIRRLHQSRLTCDQQAHAVKEAKRL